MATKAIVGGLLSGLGEGMVAQAEQRRQSALERAKEMRRQLERQEDRQFTLSRDEASRETQLERDEAQRSFQLERDEAQMESKRGLLDHQYGLKAGLEQTKAGLKGGGSGGGADDGLEGAFAMMSPHEKRTFDTLILPQYVNPNTNAIDRAGLVEHLRGMSDERGGERWNEFADLIAGDIGANMSEAEAREQAASEARQKKGFLSSRESEFPETGGDEQAWIERRAQELRGGGAGGQQRGGQQQEREQRPEPAAQGGQQASGAPPGQGTQADPYKASAQADVDWFREQAPTGSVIEVNGQLYRK